MASYNKELDESADWVVKLEKSFRSKCKNYKDNDDDQNDETGEKKKDESRPVEPVLELIDDWQCKLNCVQDRISILYNKKELSDVTFIVGKEPNLRTFYAHKFILSISSPVFEAMFKHDAWVNSYHAKPENVITLIDEEPEAFKNLLKFIYTDEVEVSSNNVLDTLYTAKKYCLNFLEKTCINFLKNCLDSDSAFFLLTKARMFNENELAENCLDYIDSMSDTFETEGFLETTEDVICEILGRDTLNMTEIDLYKSVIKWAKEECKRREIADCLDNIRKVLRKNIIKLIRFPLMSAEEFASEVASKSPKILTESEIINMFLYFNVNPKPSVEFSEVTRFKQVKIEHSICRFADIKSRWGHLGSSDKIRFSVNRLIYVTGFGLYGSTNTSSEYECTIELLNTESSTSIATNKTRFYCDGSRNVFKVGFKEPVQIDPKIQYTACATLRGLDTFYGCNGKKSMTLKLSPKESVTFNFFYESACNNGTSVEDGQIPVIYFSLNKNNNNNKKRS